MIIIIIKEKEKGTPFAPASEAFSGALQQTQIRVAPIAVQAQIRSQIQAMERLVVFPIQTMYKSSF